MERREIHFRGKIHREGKLDIKAIRLTIYLVLSLLILHNIHQKLRQ
jgi:hypothetical protein